MDPRQGQAETRLRMTFRLRPEAVAALERERARRIAAGVARQACDRGDLVDEALLRAFSKRGSK